MQLRPVPLGLLLGFLGSVMFAGSLPATRLAVTSLDPFFVTAARGSLAGFAGLIVLLALRRSFPPRRAWRTIAIASLGIGIGFPLFSALGMTTVPASHGGVVIGILPLVTAMIAAVTTRERASAGFWAAAIAGALLVCVYAARAESAGLVVGDLFLLLAVVSAASGYNAAAILTAQMPGWEVISWAVLLLLPFYVVLMFVTFPADPAAVPFNAWAGIVYAGLVAQWIAFFFWNTGLAIGGITRVSQVQLTQSFITVLIAARFNGEPIDPETILFAAAVVVVVFIGQRMRVRRASVIEKA
jgi:drug/metabolite transporter (DMT)-like permease